LVGSLLVGVTAAKALAFGTGLPLIGVDHISAHLYANELDGSHMTFPAIGLVISGGHTSLFHGKDHAQWEEIGFTQDDAAGEAFDKVAILLGLGYPGGQKIEALSREGDGRKYRFPRSLLAKDSLDFSFSGLKTAVRYHCYGHGPDLPEKKEVADGPDVAASFQEAVCDVLAEKVRRAVCKTGVSQVYLGGGVACNGRIRKTLQERGEKKGFTVAFPPPALCTDNAAMVAGIGYHLFKKGKIADLDLDVVAS
jgi:N6-L-threonylcarbamoyladenine synthase